MITIKGIFKCNEIKTFNTGKKVLKLTNSDKDTEGNYTQTYYQVWVTDKVSAMVDVQLKKKLTDKNTLLNIEGYLKVQIDKNKKYINLTIYPTKIEEYKKA